MQSILFERLRVRPKYEEDGECNEPTVPRNYLKGFGLDRNTRKTANAMSRQSLSKASGKTSNKQFLS